MSTGKGLTYAVALALVKRAKEYRQQYYSRKGWQEYCVHGVYIGTPYGADYMCGKCEDGEPSSLYAEALREAEKRTERYYEVMNSAVALEFYGHLRCGDFDKIHEEERKRLWA